MSDIMKRPNKEDFKPNEIWCAEDMVDWYKIYSAKQDEYIDFLEKEYEVKKCDCNKHTHRVAENGYTVCNNCHDIIPRQSLIKNK